MTLLPDKVYFSCPWIFAFHDVTDKLRDGGAEPITRAMPSRAP